MTPTTDKELLELAARAAGMWVLPNPWPRVHHGGWFYNPHGAHVGGMFKVDDLTRWNPLTDDGDALRLAVKLHMSFDYRQDDTVNAQFVDHRQWSTEVQFEPCGSDPYAATRRAIVRAAAAMAVSRGDAKE